MPRYVTRTPKELKGAKDEIEAVLKRNYAVDLRAHKASGETTFRFKDETDLSFHYCFEDLIKIHPDLIIYSYGNTREIKPWRS